MEGGLYEEDHELFREVAVELNFPEVAPHYQQWDQEHLIARNLCNAPGEQGLLGLLTIFGGSRMRSCAKSSARISPTSISNFRTEE